MMRSSSLIHFRPLPPSSKDSPVHKQEQMAIQPWCFAMARSSPATTMKIRNSTSPYEPIRSYRRVESGWYAESADKGDHFQQGQPSHLVRSGPLMGLLQIGASILTSLLIGAL